ncbi:MAG TPA: carboxylating nicotinate-nucleotide diphosphorylase [Acidobacteriota bacterium]|nr:carboxylating nicotinate-nucleotide diphosphorylase [Acidobacteriota bacterium]
MKCRVATPFSVPQPAYKRSLRRLVREALTEDIGTGDATTRALDLRAQIGRARLLARSDGVLAGCDAFEMVFRRCHKNVRVTWRIREGAKFRRGTTVATVRGPASAVLTGERTALNFLARLSGIATATRQLVDRMPRKATRLLDTRKTTPGWRFLEKHATAIGGACNHRLGLYDAIMVKDNHIAACGDLDTAVRRAQRRRAGRRVICEVRDMHQIETALAAGVDWLLLDNFTPARLRRAVPSIRNRERRDKRRIILEASGNITARNIVVIARTGVDFISVGAITHSAPAVDFSLKWVG